jgi:putative cell wall-binding protein
VTTQNRLRLPLLLLALVSFIALPLAAQSPNTATLIVVVVDQTGAVLPDA